MGSISKEEMPTEVVNTYLQEIGVTPVKKSSIKKHAKHKRGSEVCVLEKSRRSLKRKLGDRLFIEIPSPENSGDQSFTAESTRFNKREDKYSSILSSSKRT